MSSRSTYLQFLWKSQNAHGVHSPFVYNIVSKCFYSKELKLSRKDYKELETVKGYNETELLCRIVYFFRPEKLLAFGDGSDVLKETMRKAGEQRNRKVWFFTPNAPIPGTIDMGCIADANSEDILNYFNQILPHTNNNTVCIIENPHQSTETENAWQSIKEHPKVTVTIDAFYYGLVFFRKEQYQQHFIICTSQNTILNAVLGIKNLWGLLG